MLAIIDGDEVLYKVALSFQDKQYYVKKGDVKLYNVPNYEYAIESVCEYPDLDIDSEVVAYPLIHYHLRVDAAISRILTLSKCNDYLVCLSGKNNFRYNLATLKPYKGNREKSNPPIYLEEIRTLFKADYNFEMNDNNEADELLVYHSKKNPESVICSSDKDLRTVPGINYNIGTRVLKYISKEEAKRNWYYQILLGDDTDNIPHPYLLGEVKVNKFLDEMPEGLTELEEYNLIKEFYRPYLEAKDKDGEYKTKWYSGQDIDEVITEIANLLWMEHTPGGESRWSIPNG